MEKHPPLPLFGSLSRGVFFYGFEAHQFYMTSYEDTYLRFGQRGGLTKVSTCRFTQFGRIDLKTWILIVLSWFFEVNPGISAGPLLQSDLISPKMKIFQIGQKILKEPTQYYKNPGF